VRLNTVDSNGPATDVTDQSIRCYELDYSATPAQTKTATVSAGSSLTVTGKLPCGYVVTLCDG
jgi:hypothetical protein